MAQLARIRIHPIKSLDGMDVAEARIASGGSLAGDREFAIATPEGRILRAKDSVAMHTIRCGYDLPARTLTLRREGDDDSRTFHLDHERPGIATWLSNHLGISVVLRHNDQHGFPDDPNILGPTIVGTQSLATVCSWFPGMSIDSLRLRIRANLELSFADAFEEERLFEAEDTVVPVRIGPVTLEGVLPCPRCIVPSRDPMTGAPWPDFQKTFNDRRIATMPAWVRCDRMKHGFYLSVRTRIDSEQTGRTLRVGDEVTLLPVRRGVVIDRPFKKFADRHAPGPTGPT